MQCIKYGLVVVGYCQVVLCIGIGQVGVQFVVFEDWQVQCRVDVGEGGIVFQQVVYIWGDYVGQCGQVEVWVEFGFGNFDLFVGCFNVLVCGYDVGVVVKQFVGQYVWQLQCYWIQWSWVLD